jgi:hypothetical protein
MPGGGISGLGRQTFSVGHGFSARIERRMARPAAPDLVLLFTTGPRRDQYLPLGPAFASHTWLTAGSGAILIRSGPRYGRMGLYLVEPLGTGVATLATWCD